jgi:hypothetical protein
MHEALTQNYIEGPEETEIVSVRTEIRNQDVENAKQA